MLKKILLLSTALVSPAFAQEAEINYHVADLANEAANPLPAGSCFYVDQGPGLDRKLCVNYVSAMGGIQLDELGAGVEDFLRVPLGGVPGPWLAPGAAVANLGYTPVIPTRALVGTGMIAGGGDLSANRTFNLAAAPAATLLGNPTAGSAVPTTVTLGTNLTFDGATLNATGGGGGGTAITVQETGGVNAVADVASITVGRSLTIGTTGAGAATLDVTAAVVQDQSGAGYTIQDTDYGKAILVGAFTYAFPEAGTGNFTPGWSTCLHNVSAGAATINTTTSLFLNASNTSSVKINPGGWACPSVTEGGDYLTPSSWSGTRGYTAGLPFIGGAVGDGPAQGSRSGNTTEFATWTGTKTSGNLVNLDANGNIKDSGVSSAGGGGAIQINLSGSLSTTAIHLGHTNAAATHYNARPLLINSARTLTGLKCIHSTQPSTDTWTYTLRVNDVAQTNQQVSSTGSVNQTTTVTDVGVPVVAYDRITVVFSFTGAPASQQTSCVLTAT